jgi:isoquinoline 1-oxidoreductase beta subunit
MTMHEVDAASFGAGRAGFSRRRFLGYLIAAPTLIAAAGLDLDDEGVASASTTGVRSMRTGATGIPSAPQPSDLFDLNDLLTLAADPTANLISVTINTDGTASFALPRDESGQGISTSSAMLIAEELDLPLDKVIVTLADARPELLFNQFTAGSNTAISTFTPIRVAAALARQQLLQAAAIEFGDEVTDLTTSNGVVISPSGATLTYGQLAVSAAVQTTTPATVTLKSPSEFTIIGTPQGRIDALAIVTGQKQFTCDLAVPGALPTMVCRPPTLNGAVVSVNNTEAVLAMPGITHVAVISTGVAVRGETFGQCIDAIIALDVTWGPGNVDSQSDATVLSQLQAAAPPFAVPPVNLLAETIDASFTYYWKCNSALEPQTAIADVKPDSATIWSSMQSPILVKEQAAAFLGLPVTAVAAHVTPGGGAFGRRMFSDAPMEAVEISQAMGVPVKLMWHRTDEFRVGRTHPMCIDRIQVQILGNEVLDFQQLHTSVSTDYTQGFGEILTSLAAQLPDQNYLEYSNTIFETTVNVPYNFGAVAQSLNEIVEFDTFHTGSVRNLYNPDVVTSRELMVDQIANKVGLDPYSFRREFLNDSRALAVLNQVATAGDWGRAMARDTAQGIAVHSEYKGRVACLAEIDCTPATINRPIVDGVTGPRVTKVVFALDAGLAINPLGLQAQMMGGIMDAIGEVLTTSLHLVDGNYLEGSWDNYYYTRQWNTPLDLQIIVMPPTTGDPGGAGEFGVAAAKAAVACAYARATGTMPTSFPINHNATLNFTPYPYVPPIPESPTNGLDYTY